MRSYLSAGLKHYTNEMSNAAWNASVYAYALKEDYGSIASYLTFELNMYGHRKKINLEFVHLKLVEITMINIFLISDNQMLDQFIQ